MPFLRPLPMAKVGIIGLKDEREAVVGILHDLGILQLEPLGKETLQQLEAEKAPDVQRTVSDQLIRVRGLRTALPAQPLGPPRAFGDLPDILRAAKAVPIDDSIASLKREEDQLLTKRSDLRDTLETLAKFDLYPDRFEYLHSGTLLAFFGSASPS